jgi:hypothetical protein
VTATVAPAFADHHAAAVADADAVFAAMQPDLLACYRAQWQHSPRAHAFMTIDVLINDDGTVRRVETTGGAMLGEAGLACITQRVKRASFAPVWGGGTLQLSVPVVFRASGVNDTI